ncbi:AraC family transcriptional regulator [Mesorhizobium sp. M7D.F.Ca.US.005.01.1.1]|uniref:AraC family transcriptional regulator n=1 Tax=Mesorhizobium sp. M7D.F.Ca.US.005.01.1.1 TaxID=2493678 RepID=UPI001FDFE072|nr:AraC family transcriptional regulator [Mesorhizobium sp. M7D.F.Ca.US.005.01.1.1]
MDPLTDIIALLRPKTLLLGNLAATGEWGIRSPYQTDPTFYLVTEGECWFQAENADAVRLCAGDYLLAAQPCSACFVSHIGAKLVLSDAEFKERNTIDNEVRVGSRTEGPTTRILGGLIICDPANADLLFGLLPRFTHIRAAEDVGERLAGLMRIIVDETHAARPARDMVLSRLIEVMLIETLRRDGAQRASQPQGLLGGLADPQLAKALTHIHSNVGRAWTIAELAKTAGMSRSRFARRFVDVVGAAPVEYLLSWRMALAKDALLHSQKPLSQIAADVGYQSPSAFSTAFSGKVGCAPTQYAARSRGETMPGETRAGMQSNLRMRSAQSTG